MTELSELDKEFVDKIGEMSSDDIEEGRKDAIEELKEHGGVSKKTPHTTPWGDTHTVFIMNDGHKQTYAPRGYKFRGPIVPQGIDIKQFEVK
ncbi:hypothetical protein AGMMS50212_17300 [Spirochaetia bacterium]|nr:hypothetical protein AGMMS50212_17300 [Spirochaetia bacterium]